MSPRLFVLDKQRGIYQNPVSYMDVGMGMMVNKEADHVIT